MTDDSSSEQVPVAVPGADIGGVKVCGLAVLGWNFVGNSSGFDLVDKEL